MSIQGCFNLGQTHKSKAFWQPNVNVYWQGSKTNEPTCSQVLRTVKLQCTVAALYWLQQWQKPWPTLSNTMCLRKDTSDSVVFHWRIAMGPVVTFANYASCSFPSYCMIMIWQRATWKEFPNLAPCVSNGSEMLFYGWYIADQSTGTVEHSQSSSQANASYFPPNQALARNPS